MKSRVAEVGGDPRGLRRARERESPAVDRSTVRSSASCKPRSRRRSPERASSPRSAAQGGVTVVLAVWENASNSRSTSVHRKLSRSNVGHAKAETRPARLPAASGKVFPAPT